MPIGEVSRSRCAGASGFFFLFPLLAFSQPPALDRGWRSAGRRCVEVPMADDLNNRCVQHRSRVSMNDEHEVSYWTTTLGCSKNELAAAVARVGNSADAVRRELRRAWGYG